MQRLSESHFLLWRTCFQHRTYKTCPCSVGHIPGSQCRAARNTLQKGQLITRILRPSKARLYSLLRVPFRAPLFKAIFGKRSLVPSSWHSSSRHLYALIRFPLTLHHPILPSLWTSYQRVLDLFHRNDGQTSHIPAQASSIPSFHHVSVWPTKSLLKTWRRPTCSWKRHSSVPNMFRGVSERKQNKSLLSVGVVEAALKTSLKYTIPSIC